MTGALPEGPLSEPPEPLAEPAALWWNTYAAAVSGACGNPTLQHLGFDGLHDFAVRIANRAHGTLQPLSTHAARQLPEVQALMDAVGRLLDAHRASDSSEERLAVLDARIGPLENALVPFLTPDPEPTP